MACSCKKFSRKATRIVTPAQRGFLQSANTPAAPQIRPTAALPNRNSAGMTIERRILEKKRRDAIRSALGH